MKADGLIKRRFAELEAGTESLLQTANQAAFAAFYQNPLYTVRNSRFEQLRLRVYFRGYLWKTVHIIKHL